MTAPKYILFNFEGDTTMTSVEAIMEQYKDYDPGLIVRCTDGRVWGGHQWDPLPEAVLWEEEEEEEEEIRGHDLSNEEDYPND